MFTFKKIRKIIAKHNKDLLDYFDLSNMYINTFTGQECLIFKNPKTGERYECTLTFDKLNITIQKNAHFIYAIWE